MRLNVDDDAAEPGVDTEILQGRRTARSRAHLVQLVLENRGNVAVVYPRLSALSDALREQPPPHGHVHIGELDLVLGLRVLIEVVTLSADRVVCHTPSTAFRVENLLRSANREADL